MLGLVFAPNLFAGVVFGILFAVFFAANFTGCLLGAGGRSAGMLAYIFALFANAVYPGMILFGYGLGVTAVPLLGMLGLVFAPNLFAGVVFGIFISVFCKTNVTGRLIGAGGRAADVIVADYSTVAYNGSQNVYYSVVGKGLALGNDKGSTLGNGKGDIAV